MGAKTKKPAVSKAMAKLQAKHLTILGKLKSLTAARDAMEKRAATFVRAFERIRAAHEKTMAKYNVKIDAANSRLEAYADQRVDVEDAIASQERRETAPTVTAALGTNAYSGASVLDAGPVVDVADAADIPDPPRDDDDVGNDSSTIP